MQRPKVLFTQSTTAGVERIEGAVVILVCWWIDQGGLRELEQVADQVNFGALKVKRDDNIGRMVTEVRDFGKEMLAALWAEPMSKFILETLDLKPEEPLPDACTVPYHPLHMMRYRVEGFIGHALQDSGWWSRNEKRIKKEREDYKKVRAVMES